jgi:hypothetical protein
MATVTKFADAHTTVVTGWSSPTLAFADDGSYATAAPGKNATISGRFGFPAFSSGDIPDNSTINSVTVEVQWKVSTTSSIDTLGVQLHNPAGTGLGSEFTTTTLTTSDTVNTQQVTSGISLTDLRSANVVVAHTRATRGNSNTAFTASLDYVKVTVDYTAPPPEVTLAATIAGVSGVSAAMDVESPGGEVTLSATVASDSSVAAALSVERTFVAAIAGVSGLSGALAVERSLSSAIAGVSSMTAALAVEHTLAAVVAAESGLTAALTVETSGGPDPTESGFISMIPMMGGL